jgi:hypothetical protein
MDNKYFNTPAPGFSKFRDLMETWDKYCLLQEAREKIGDMLDAHQLSLFFKKGKDYFGAPENSRIIFAKLKNDDEEDDDPMMPGFRDEAKFLALNLLKSMIGGAEDSSETMFGLPDIPQIKVCDRDEVIDKMLSYKPKKEKAKKKDE